MKVYMHNTHTAYPTKAAFIMPFGNDKFTCIVDDMKMGTSRDSDYFEYHYKRGGIKALQGVELGKFVYIDAQGKIEHITDATITRKESIRERHEAHELELQAAHTLEAFNKSLTTAVAPKAVPIANDVVRTSTLRRSGDERRVDVPDARDPLVVKLESLLGKQAVTDAAAEDTAIEALQATRA